MIEPHVIAARIDPLVDYLPGDLARAAERGRERRHSFEESCWRIVLRPIPWPLKPSVLDEVFQ